MLNCECLAEYFIFSLIDEVKPFIVRTLKNIIALTGVAQLIACCLAKHRVAG